MRASRWVLMTAVSGTLAASAAAESVPANAVPAKPASAVPTPAAPVRPPRPPTLAFKVHTIVLPDMNFRNATLSQIVDFIVDRSREADPEGVGVSIIVKDDARGTLRNRRLTLNLRKPTIEEAFRLLSSAAGLTLRIDRSAVVVEVDTDVIVRPPAPR